MINNQNNEGFIPVHGGYRNLMTYQKSEIIYDGTVYFTGRFFHKYDRTVGQMVQAARSGKQNIAEASMASATSKETETAGCFGIYYGDGKGLDACNIFAKVIDSDKQKLIDLGNSIWKNGSQELTISLTEL